ncbi:MAG: ABC transporter ATP-binding protein [Candidatus Zixiibacteriota bacterium]
MDVIETFDLCRRFDKTIAIDRLNLKIRKGELFGLVGPDGAGKTTMLRLLSGILEPTSGTAEVAGFDIIQESEKLKEHIGYMPQRFGLYEDLTVEENLDFFSDIFEVPEKERGERIRELMDFSQLYPFRRYLAGNLSGGMKQKLGLSCVLIHRPEILLLDEPTTGVDPSSRRDFWKILFEQLKIGTTIFISTPYMDEAERCHRVGMLHKGNLLAVDTPDEIKKLLSGHLIEITTDQPRKAWELTQKSDVSVSSVLFGDRLHLLVKDPEKDIQTIENELVRSNIKIDSIQRISPTLEDVFFSFLKTNE